MNRQEAVEELMRMASQELPEHKSHIEPAPVGMSAHRSSVIFKKSENKAQYIQIYYKSEDDILPALAHEMGHVMTLPELGGVPFYQESYQNEYDAEFKASQWACAWLVEHVEDDRILNSCLQRLQLALDSYWHFYQEHRIPMNPRYILTMFRMEEVEA